MQRSARRNLLMALSALSVSACSASSTPPAQPSRSASQMSASSPAGRDPAPTAASTGPDVAVRPAGPGPVTITVPGDAASISGAVAVARAGDLVLISPGIYSESVKVGIAGITLRGVDRNTVVLDEGLLHANGITVTAPAVSIENLTIRNASGNGLLFTGVSDGSGAGVAAHDNSYATLDPTKFPPLRGFHVDHVTSDNNGLYGIYAFDAQYGLIENSYTSGGADSGLYVGQCKPCHILVRGNVSEHNAVGFEAANAGPDLIITGNRFVGNRVGATILSDYQEAFLPQTAATLTGNVVAANNEPKTPEQADGGFGIGIGIGGGTENLVSANLVVHNDVVGLALTSSEDLGPKDNTITGNSFSGNRLDVAYLPSARGPARGNCLSGNHLLITSPSDLATSLACPAHTDTVAAGSLPAVTPPAGIAFTDVVAPPTLPNLAGVHTVPAPWKIIDVPGVAVAEVVTPAATLLAGQSIVSW